MFKKHMLMETEIICLKGCPVISICGRSEGQIRISIAERVSLRFDYIGLDTSHDKVEHFTSSGNPTYNFFSINQKILPKKACMQIFK